ncbi:MAG: VCBS repeat-containing protein, partial [Planctomycetes bacterium]|nr:VCBS repeat-containing protein [Planctomycetota bacterium]
MPTSARSVATVAIALQVAVVAQQPLLAEFGEVVPDGVGQLVGVADYDGDGDVDLFSTVGVFRNDGGFFTPGARLPGTFDPNFNIRAIAVGDVDGDGRVDYLVGRAGGQPAGIALFTAPPPNGAAFVAAPTPLAGRSDLREFAVADFDLDGDLDVVAAPSYSSTAGWVLLRNDGAGGFTTAPAGQWPGTDANISFVAAGDFDGDGLIDVYASTANGERWRRNLGGGAFAASQPIGSGIVVDSGAVGDFDGDGCDDLLVVDVFGGEAVHRGSAAGPQAGAVALVGPLGAPPVARDRDLDGFDDLLRSVVPVSGSLDGTLYERRGGPGGLGPMVAVASVAHGYGNPTPYPGVAVADLDLDGDLDTLLVPGGMAPITLLQDAAGGYTTAAKNVPPGLVRLFAPPRDVDGDGDADLLHAVLDAGVYTLTTFRNDGRGTFTPPVPAGSMVTASAAGTAWVDLDSDGDDDLWVGSPFAPLPSLAMLNDGSGVFSLGASVPLGGATAVAFGDFTGDGIVDVVAGLPVLSPFPLILQRPVLIEGVPVASGVAFLPPVPFGTTELWTDVVAFDDGGDGDLDLLVATNGLFAGTAPARIYQNDGTGAFTALAPFVGATAPSVAVGDLDGDQVPELVLGDQVWRRQLNGYAFVSAHPLPRGPISLADLDEDGRLDLFDAAGQCYL